jgi:hypothetical protein
MMEIESKINEEEWLKEQRIFASDQTLDGWSEEEGFLIVLRK